MVKINCRGISLPVCSTDLMKKLKEHAIPYLDSESIIRIDGIRVTKVWDELENRAKNYRIYITVKFF